MFWDATTIEDWYGRAVGRRIKARLLRKLKRWPVLRWAGREPPRVLALGCGEVLHDLWPGVWEVPGARGENRFDRMVALHVLEHDKQPLELLEACRRELSGGGLLLVIVPNKWSLARWAPDWSPFALGRGYTAGRMARLAAEGGFTLLHQQTLVSVWPGGKGGWAWAPGLVRVGVFRKDEPAVMRMPLKPVRGHGTAKPVGVALVRE